MFVSFGAIYRGTVSYMRHIKVPHPNWSGVKDGFLVATPSADSPMDQCL